MVVAELALSDSVSNWTNAAFPFVFQANPAKRIYADYWIDIFGAEDDQITATIRVSEFYRDATVFYTQMTSLSDCKLQEQSFYFDFSTQILYVHFEHEYGPRYDGYTYGAAFGFTDNTIQYFDDIEYLPLIKESPKYSKQVDFANLGRLSFIEGSMTLMNDGGILDSMINSPIYGNAISLFFGEAGDDYGDLIQTDSFFVEDYNWTLSELVIKLQDQRKSQDVDIPVELFNSTDYPKLENTYEGKIIPLVFGICDSWPCTPVNGQETSGSTRRYRACTVMSSNPTNVYVKIDDAWVARTPSNIDLATGEFDIPNAITTQGAPYKAICTCTGYAITYASDIIKILNEEFLNIEYISSNYDTTEWEAEEVYLSAIGYGIDAIIKLPDAIAEIQNKSNVGFFYDILGDGRRTIRVDNPNRTPVAYIQNIELSNIDELPVETDSTYLYSKVRVNYSKNWEASSFYSFPVNIYEANVISLYKNRSELIVDSYLKSSSLAEDRATIDAENYSVIRPIILPELMGREYFTFRRFDVVDIEYTPGFVDADNDTITGREYFGVVRGQIIELEPDYKNEIMKAKIRIRPYSNVFEEIYA